MNIQIIIHESFEGPGAIQYWIDKHKYSCSYTRLYEGDKLPNSSEVFDMLVIMGGPQSPGTSKEECHYFDSMAEQYLIKDAVEKGKIVLGICLGAQLISNALGGITVASTQKEIGLHPVTLTDSGRDDRLFTDFPETFDCGHWHSDMPGLTEEATIIAQSDGCPRQIIRFAQKVYAFQCHFEFTPNAINDMIANCADELEKEKDKPFVQSAEQLIINDYGISNKLLFSFLDRLVE